MLQISFNHNLWQFLSADSHHFNQFLTPSDIAWWDNFKIHQFENGEFLLNVEDFWLQDLIIIDDDEPVVTPVERQVLVEPVIIKDHPLVSIDQVIVNSLIAFENQNSTSF